MLEETMPQLNTKIKHKTKKERKRGLSNRVG